jgi:hypothetical protein
LSIWAGRLSGRWEIPLFLVGINSIGSVAKIYLNYINQLLFLLAEESIKLRREPATPIN